MNTPTRVLLSCILVLVLGLPALAESARGTITGLVRDSSGAVIPGADITITAKATAMVTRTVSTEAGAYRAPYIPPGTYHITASLSGFKTAVADNIQVLVGQTVTVDFALQIGELSDQVTVLAETPLLEASNPEIGINATEKEVHAWPVSIRLTPRFPVPFNPNPMVVSAHIVSFNPHPVPVALRIPHFKSFMRDATGESRRQHRRNKTRCYYLPHTPSYPVPIYAASKQCSSQLLRQNLPFFKTLSGPWMPIATGVSIGAGKISSHWMM